MANFVKGNNVILKIWDGSSAYEPIGCLTSNTLSTTTNVMEAQTKCDPNVIIKEGGTTSSEISSEAIFAEAGGGIADYETLFDLVNTISGTNQYWEITTTLPSGATDRKYGFAVIADLEMTSAAGDEFATFSGTLQNSGLVLDVNPKA